MKQPASINRRRFLQASVAGAVGLEGRAAVSKPAPMVRTAKADLPVLLGGKPVRSGGFPGWPEVDEEDRRIWREVLDEKAWCELHGSQVARFEEEFARAMGRGYVVATANGTSSLHAALYAFDVGPGDEVLMPANTFVATMQAILNLYALPIFVDVDPATGQIDARKIEEKITSHTRAIIPVHLGGAAADMDGILAVTRRRNLRVVEDACQSALAEWNGTKLGLLGDCGAISFQVTKILAAGEGGAVVTNDPELRTLVHAFRNNGRDPGGRRRNYPYMGMNYRMTEFQGALLRTQLAKFQQQSRRRRENAEYLIGELRGIEGVQPLAAYPGNNLRDYYYLALRYEPEAFSGLSIDRFVSAMRAEGIPISGSSARDVLSHSESIPRVLESRGFRRIYSEERLDWCRSCLECPETERLAARQLSIGQPLLLGARSDLDDILLAMAKIQRHAQKLKDQSEVPG